MKIKNIFTRICLVVISIIIMAPPFTFGKETGTVTPQYKFSEEELDQMLAPIALYPDSLLAQMLMAATYPLEMVEASRWIGQHPNLKDELLDEALLEKDWDVSVKSVAHFPQVLAMMDENIEWTTRLGDAFLVQKDEVMDTIQELRVKAEAAGNLRSTEEQRVVAEPGVITIAPAYPGVIYVPVYDPFWVYGPWWYTAYPPFAFYYPGVAITSGFFGFAFGFATGFGFGWCDWDWHHHDIYINYDRIGHFHRFHHNRFYGRARWEHDPGHRRGVAYWNRERSHRFGQHPDRSVQSRNEFRGYGDRNFRRQPTESFTRQRVTRENFNSRNRDYGQQFGSQRNLERREFGARERFQQRDRTNTFSRFGTGKKEGFASDRGRFSRESREISRGRFRSDGGRGFLGGGGGFRSSGESSHGYSGGFRNGSGGFRSGSGGFYGGGGRGR